MSNLIGQSLGRYHILEQLGEGGMATVFKAYDTRLETDVAVKVIRTDVLPQNAVARTLKRFEREAKSLARLTHPNIVKVMDYGEHDGAPYLVLVYLPGGTLKKHMGTPMPWQEAVRLLIPIANALDYAHEQKIIHRDVKPANILLTVRGQPMLTDFGIAKILELEDGQTLTGTGMGIGTPEYMSPEQGMGREVDGRTDIYSMGIILYELITGRKPYTADTPMAVVLKHMTDSLPRPRQFVPNLPDAVEKVLIKSLAKDPKDRFPDAGAFTTAMENLLMGMGQKPVPTPSVRKQIEPDLETQDTYIQEETNSTRSKTGPYTEAPRKARTPQMINPPGASLPKKIVWWPWAFGGIGLILAVMTFSNSNFFAPAATEAPAPIATEVLFATEAPAAPEAPIATEMPVATEIASDGSSMIGEDGMTLLNVPAGEFTMGSDSSDQPDEKPAHTVYLDAFWIDQTEVTNQLFSDFMSATGYQTDAEKAGSSYIWNGTDWVATNGADWQHPTGPASNISSKADHPVVHISWNDAVAYCEWAGRRLPTEAEWEKAARGTDGRTYPWGETEPSANLLNFNMNIGDTTPVGNYPNGVSPYGAYDMAGNVWEWVSSLYKLYPYDANDGREDVSVESRVLRGGSWLNLGVNVRSSNRYRLDPTVTNDVIGFRCARSH